VKEPDKVDEVTARIRAALDDLKATPVPAERLAQVKSHHRYAFLMGLGTAPSVARRAAQYLELAGDVGAIDKVDDLYNRVTPADIQAAAKRFFVPENRTRVILAQKQEAKS
jgi:zinc protease